MAISPLDLELFLYLSLDPEHEYGLFDMDDADSLHRALRLLVHSHFGDEDERYKLTP
jgi:hypothetical protein